MVALHNVHFRRSLTLPRVNLPLIAALGFNACLWLAIIAALRHLI